MSAGEDWLRTAEDFFGDNDMPTAQAAALIAIGWLLSEK